MELDKELHLVCGIAEYTGDDIIDGLKKHELVNVAQENGMDSYSDAAELLVMIGKRIDSLAKH